MSGAPQLTERDFVTVPIFFRMSRRGWMRYARLQNRLVRAMGKVDPVYRNPAFIVSKRRSRRIAARLAKGGHR